MDHMSKIIAEVNWSGFHIADRGTPARVVPSPERLAAMKRLKRIVKEIKRLSPADRDRLMAELEARLDPGVEKQP